MSLNPTSRRHPSRREFLGGALGAVSGLTVSGWFDVLAHAANVGARKRSCILLWMAGGPSQTDTFDLKPSHENGGPFKPIETNVPGIQICEHLPKLALHADKLALIRSMSTKEGDHDRGAYFLRTGYQAGGPVDYPSIGALLGKELGGAEDAELPRSVSIAQYKFINPAAFGAGYLGPRYMPLSVGSLPMQLPPNQQPGVDIYEQMFQVRNLSRPADVSDEQAAARRELLTAMESKFHARRHGPIVAAHQTAYAGAERMMQGKAASAFRLENESRELRDRYGRTPFGQGCLLARRLVEQGVSFVEVAMHGVGPQDLLGWDTHQENFTRLPQLLGVLDNGWATLMADLAERGLLESTLIVWMGEFGRTPSINAAKGRDHFPAAWTAVLGGGGIKGGTVVGRTSENGMEVTDRPVPTADFFSTIVRALGLDPMQQNMSNVGRPIRLAEPTAKPLVECLL